MLKDRISLARGCLHRFGVDAIVFLSLPNIRYLAKFTGSDGALVVGKDDGWFLTDSRYVTQASVEVSSFRSLEYRGKLEGICSLLKEIGAKKVGFEAEHTTVSFFKALAAELPGVELIAIGAALDELRLIKGADEIELLSKTAEIASVAFLNILNEIKPGVKERDVALALEIAMKRGGAEEKSFDFIVASGFRGALPHGRASDKVITAGELVTFDYGAVYLGYCSDETVTIAVGKPDAQQKEVHAIVKTAHDRAIEAVKPGIGLKELDGIARSYIEEKGYGKFFGHGLGHGVGLEVHEKPVVSYKSKGIVEEGMVFTVEPGIYIPDWGGVRIEDTVMVTSDGCRLLTKVPKELMII